MLNYILLKMVQYTIRWTYHRTWISCLILMLSLASEIIFLSIFFKFYFGDMGLLFYNITTIHQTQGTSELWFINVIGFNFLKKISIKNHCPMHLTTNIFISLDYTIIHLHKEDSKYRYEIICLNLRSVGFF